MGWLHAETDRDIYQAAKHTVRVKLDPLADSGQYPINGWIVHHIYKGLSARSTTYKVQFWVLYSHTHALLNHIILVGYTELYK